MSRGRQLQIDNYQQDLTKLEKDYTAVAEKKRRESNPQEQHNLQLQLASISKEIHEIERLIETLKQQEKEDNIKSLLEILTHSEEILTAIQKAYQACSPEGWLYSKPEDIEKTLKHLKTMSQGSSKYTRVERFVACLLADNIIPSLVSEKLREWAEQNINNFLELLTQEQQNLEEKNRNTNSYLLVLIERSEQNSAISYKSDIYTVNAWFIRDIQNYKYEIGTGCEPLEFSDKHFTFDEITRFLKKCLDEISKDSYKNLTLEIFLPLNLLNCSVDRWKLEDDLDLGFSPIIGQDYKVVVRSCERLTKTYNRRRVFWEEKWETLKRHTHPSASSPFMSIDDETVNNLMSELKSPKIFGLRAERVPKKIGKGSIFAAILETAIPVALWLRQNLPDLDCKSEIDQILDRCITKLPEYVKEKRCGGIQNTDTHIGHHLSLLWEDPNRLPPSINYS